MREFPNALSDSLENDEQFNKEVQKSIIKKFEATQEVLLSTDKVVAKIINGVNNIRYLIVKNSEESEVKVYSEKISDYNQSTPFQYALDSLEKNGKCYSDLVYSYSLLGKVEAPPSWESIVEKIDSGKFAEGSQELKELMGQMLESMKLFRKNLNGEKVYQTTASPFKLKQFLESFNVNCSDDFIVEHSKGLNAIVQNKLEDVLINLNYLFDVAEKNKFDHKNKFTFNDLDNHLWNQEKGIVVDDQNCGFYCVAKGNDYIIYAYDNGYNDSKLSTSFEELQVAIKENPNDLIGTVALKIENGNVVFVDNAFIYSLYLDLQFTRDALMDEGYGEPTYPVDIFTYEYQYAYAQKCYGYTDFAFLDHVFTVLGNGYNYDKEKGRFYSTDVAYDPSIVGFKVEEKEGKAESIYGYPNGFSYLDEDWTEALGRYVEKLKTDRPLPICFKEDEKENKLNELIELFEDKYNELRKKHKLKI